MCENFTWPKHKQSTYRGSIHNIFSFGKDLAKVSPVVSWWNVNKIISEQVNLYNELLITFNKITNWKASYTDSRQLVLERNRLLKRSPVVNILKNSKSPQNKVAICVSRDELPLSNRWSLVFLQIFVFLFWPFLINQYFPGDIP
jgi:hypothetical protein